MDNLNFDFFNKKFLTSEVILGWFNPLFITVNVLSWLRELIIGIEGVFILRFKIKIGDYIVKVWVISPKWVNLSIFIPRWILDQNHWCNYQPIGW